MSTKVDPVFNYVLNQSFIYLGMKKSISDEAFEKAKGYDDNEKNIQNFISDQEFYMFLFAIQQGKDNVQYFAQPPPPEKMKKSQKCLLIIRARSKKELDGGGALTMDNIHQEVVFNEIVKPVLENLYGMCHDVYQPILANPHNMIGWSDLVSQDLMDRFHLFQANTKVTIGQIKGMTLLPEPPKDITSSEKTSSKDKAQILEISINTWTNQIKNVLKQDPENALKKGNHPDPLTELEFWKNKSENLNSICDQLNSERIKKVLKFLEQNKSTYTGPFSKLQKEVHSARQEANENYKYLQTLAKLFNELTDASKELPDTAELFVPIMHTILLIWTYSQYYNTPSRLVVLIREICNAVINQCRGKINGEEIFGFIKSEEVGEAHNKLTLAVDVCYKFKDAYFDYKAQSKNQWKITTNALFVRLDAFLERCQDILHLTTTIKNFQKLPNINIGNTKGKTLTASIQQIYDEFDVAVKEFMEVTYDIMDIEKRMFDDDFYKFRQSIKGLERRLASILSQAFDDSDTIVGKFKLLDSFEGLLTRPIIQDELEKKHITLLELYKQDLKTVGAIFMEGKALVDKVDERAPISNNLPPITGALNWTTGLLERISEPMDKLSILSQSIKDREEYKDVCKLYHSLCKNLKEYNDQKISTWEQGVEDNTEEKLNKFLLYREETPVCEEGFVRVNFDPVLVRLLREVKYLLILNIEVPERAQLLFKKVDIYRTQTGNLDIIVDMYNNILSTLLPVEKPLLADKIEKMNNALQKGINELKWNSQNIDPFIKQAMEIVTTQHELVGKMKSNVKKIQNLMKEWENPLFERKNRPSFPEDLEQTHQSLVMPRLEEIRNHGKEIHKALKDSYDAIRVDKKGQNWLAYVDYVNSLVIDGITTGIIKSMEYLSDQINIPYNKHRDLPPIFDIRVDLQDREVIFDPSIEENSRQNGIKDILQKIIDDFISLSIQMPRLDTNQGDYLVEIKDQFVIFSAFQVITNNFNDIKEATNEFIDQYKDKEFLWKETLSESFQKFLNTGKDPKEEKHLIEVDGEEVEDETFSWMADKILNGVHTKKPDLEHFDETITSLTRTKDNINSLKQTVDIGWLRINATPLIKELQNTVAEWINTYTSFLLNNTIKEIANIEEFITEVTEGIKNPPTSADKKSDKDHLMRVMTHLRDVKMIKDRTLAEIEPMKQVVMLLKKHNLKMEEDFLVKLENSKTALVEVSEKALGPVKEQIIPLQTKEATNIKDRLRKFEIKVGEYRQEFQNNLPYNVVDVNPETIEKAYQTISDYYIKTGEIEEEAKELNNLETLFDMTKSTYKHLRDCQNELVSLKQMWDLIALIDYQFDSWKSTLWDKIDTELLMQLIKEMQTKQCNPQSAQNKEIKSYKSFTALNDRVKNMNTILPLISQLHSEFMMERHWKKMMATTQQTIAFNSPKFCLDDLIKLELYKYSEEVTELVDGAAKEAKIESKLKVIQDTWETQVFEFKEWNENPILGALDEIVEFVETHSMELMGMSSSKDVEEFREKVNLWQGNLKTVDQVIGIWVKVQRNWQRLQPIFCASEDIRAQLPDDTRRFEQIDNSFKEMMREAREEPGVVTACTWEGRQELLTNFFSEIELCEKALNEYLQQKKKIFARFYFVSDQALLDILSNGTNPEKVDEYLGDCFDGMKCLDFIRGPGIPYPSKRAKGMYSKENEYVPFTHPNGGEFTMSGAVENYLCDLEKCMQINLRDQLEIAKQTADNWEISDRKRHEWLEDYCAQIALLTTQVMWTEETIRAFDELDGGNENAMKEHFAQIVGRIKDLINCVRKQLTKDLRVKIITIITVDVHGRDVVEMYNIQKIVDSGAFQWASQLKFYMELKNPKDDKRVCVSRICDWQTYYNYEYVGNCGRLVITPLTDRCYITLTQALNLSMGGAPAGPAGTGKTETTKDLGRALGLQVVVFNCSDQMNYISMALIFMGLSQSGSWGCFDEFNRISIDVLSVVATQVKEVLDAIVIMKQNPAKNTFLFMDEEIGLRLTVGFFITMNPGYAGRTELPENLKALFRSCAMVVPDIVLICENMLMSEGFATAKGLSKKFMCLYNLAKSLLSKQIHYDWGLRAVKSVLRQAGGLKRAEPDIDEEIILKRGLRDFNWPKIVVDDRSIFLGLINDLFPGIEAPQQINALLEERIKKCTKAEGLQDGTNDFTLKVVQLAEILDVRHSVFLIGNPGAAKSTIWKILEKTNCITPLDESNPDGPKNETISAIVDPKAVTNDELYGCMNPKTREWKDGVLSVIMRDMNKCTHPFKEEHTQKWIVLDGDVDPEWIETMNTVMDDNKVLTLVSQERIPLTPSMRLLLEISHLKNATPATVSRGGVLFINDSDVGWKAYFDSWLSKYKAKDEIAFNQFTLAQSTYLAESFLDLLKSWSHITPVCDMGQVCSLTCIIDNLYQTLYTNKAQHDMMKRYKEENNEEKIKEIYEAFFLFAGMWAYGASLDEDKLSFNGQWKGMAKTVKFPDINGTFVWDFFFDPIEHCWKNWTERTGAFDKTFDGLFQNLVVPTAETARQKFLLDMHVAARKGMLYVGSAGTGKTTIIKDYFTTLDKEFTLSEAINFNNYTDSKALQVVIESKVDKRAGNRYGPPTGKTLIYFMDDLNMPFLDKYGTQSPICLIRQVIDYKLLYTREQLDEKKYLYDCMFTACMNPKSGSFIVDLRLTRHFTLVACVVPEKEILTTIYHQILDNHFATFDKSIAELSSKIISATQQVFINIATNPQFMPTARKFHYQFNLRDFSKVVQNINLAQPGLYKGKPNDIIRLWAHECHRVWLDRLIFEEDRNMYMNWMTNALKDFGDLGKPDVIFEEPLMYTSYVAACEGHEASYLPVTTMEKLKEILEAKLEEYNEAIATMNLVLFNQAMEHVSRISRIIDLPVGSALLVGVGGSGKQSLAKLSSFILGYDIARIVVTTSYGMNELKEDIKNMFSKCGVAGSQLLFILTDSQITKNQFLVYINDLLSAGWIPELFPKEDIDGLIGKVRSEAKAAGFQDTPDSLFDFLLDKVRKNLHMALCFSPVGDAFRFRARMFPGIINCTSIDWFHDWPLDALIDVSARFLNEIDFPTDEIKEAIGAHMSFVHLSIADANADFRIQERRHNYTTPTSFLELISFYKLLLAKKQDKIQDQIGRLEIGLGIMASTTEKVDQLKELLVHKSKDVAIEKERTDELIEIVGKEQADAEKEEEAANIQEIEVNKVADAAKVEKEAADAELAEAIPAMEAATEAVNCLEAKSIQELKALGSPPEACVDVAKAVLILKQGEKKNHGWPNAQKMMGNPKKFIDDVKAFDGNNIDEWRLEALQPLLKLPHFNFDIMKGKSIAAAYLCGWIVNIVRYNTIYKKVKPLKDAAQAAQDLADEKQAELAVVKEKVRVIQEKVAELKANLQTAIDKKQKVVDEEKALLDQLDLANRLVNGLADENVRWKNNVVTYKQEKITMIGDALVSAAFVSYIGPFNAQFRYNLWHEKWIPDMTERKVPFTEGIDPLKVLANDSDQAIWKTQGLPADRVSLENAAVVVSCNRYPLLIDPQLQGQKWIKGKEGGSMVVIQLSQKKWQTKVEMAVSNGSTLMIESIGQDIDPILDPLLSKQFVKKGKTFTVKLGSEDVEIASSFKLYLQTKLINPHYKPETAAQCTITNFIVTESGLEDQLLAMVVKQEKPDLESTKEELVSKQNQFMITLSNLESELLQSLSDADPATILQNFALIEQLETTKKTSTEITEQQIIAKQTEKTINELREVYRRVAAEGAMLYFLLIQLNIIDKMYQYSLESFTVFFFKAIEKTEPSEDDEVRVLALRDMIRMTIYQYVSRGLFEKHKQIFRCQLTFRLMQKKILSVDYTEKEMFFLLNCPSDSSTPNPLKEWLPDLAWYTMNKLCQLELFETFGQNVEKEAPNRFKDWYNELTPEDEKLPLEWKKLEQMPFQKLLVIRVMRPDRITTAMDNFIRKTLPKGDDYVDCDSTSNFFQILESAYNDSTTTTPIYFILSPGANPVITVEELARKQGVDLKNLHKISLGQGQDIVAMNKLDIGHKEGHWVMLQNVHLMPQFLLELEKKLDEFAQEGSAPGFRLFLSSDPSNSIPIGLLEKSIKLTNEPPQGVKQNMKRAFTFFSKEQFEDKDPKIKTILFSLCYFHTVMLERRKFGPKGWNMRYPFSVGDLRDSALVMNNYMESNAASGKIPWDDLKYLIGEIMYGGHVVNDMDRVFVIAFLNNLMNDSLLDEAELFPFIEGKNITFKCPPPNAYEKYIEYIETECPPETPLAFGMDPNAEIDFRTGQCIELFQTLQEIQPRGSGGGGDGGVTVQDVVQDFIRRVNDDAQLDSNKLNIDDIKSKINEEQQGPYQNTFLQECEYMNILIRIIVSKLEEIVLAFKGELTMTDNMEQLMNAIFLNKVPPIWEKYAFVSKRSLGSWLDNLQARLYQLNLWKDDPTTTPKVTFLNRLFNPESFLTAIQQVFSRANQQELNKLTIQTDVQKKLYWEPDLPPVKEGAYVFGFQVEGARWDVALNQLEESRPKKQFSVVPVIQCKAVPLQTDGKVDNTVYKCPVYKTENRGNTYVFQAQLKTKQPPQKWILAGVALILDVEGVSDAFGPGKEVPII